MLTQDEIMALVFCFCSLVICLVILAGATPLKRKLTCPVCGKNLQSAHLEPCLSIVHSDFHFPARQITITKKKDQ